MFLAPATQHGHPGALYDFANTQVGARSGGGEISIISASAPRGRDLSAPEGRPSASRNQGGPVQSLAYRGASPSHRQDLARGHFQGGHAYQGARPC